MERDLGATSTQMMVPKTSNVSLPRGAWELRGESQNIRERVEKERTQRPRGLTRKV